MNRLQRFFSWRLSSDTFDLRFARLVCFPAGPALLVLALWKLSTLSLTPVQAFLGILLSVTTALSMVMLAVMLRPEQARFRLDQCGCFLVGVLVLGGSLWKLSTLDLSPVEGLLGVLLSLTAGLSFILLGMLLPLLRVPRQA